MFLLNKWKMQPQLWILIAKLVILWKLHKKISAHSIASFRQKITETWMLKNPPSLRNQSTQILRQYAINPHKSSVSTQSIHTNPPSVRNQSTQTLRQYAMNPHKFSVSTQSIHTNPPSVRNQSAHPPSVRNQSTQILRQCAINPHKSLQSADPIWRPVTLSPSAAHKHTHCHQLNQQHAQSVVQLSSSRHVFSYRTFYALSPHAT